MNNKIDFDNVIENNISRRGFLKSSVVFGTGAFVASSPLSSAIAGFWNKDTILDFSPVKANTLDTITVPKGFNWHTVASWGEPMWSKGVWFNHNTCGDGKSQSLAFGDNNDGMDVFTDGDKTILAVNNEYTNLDIMYKNRKSKRPETLDDVVKGKNAHGVSIMEIANKNNKWSIVKNSKYNRKITADSTMEITGPARGHRLLRTSADPLGIKSLGTWNNCGNGKTPWGTYLTCEENFNGYFLSSDKQIDISPEFKRYGIKSQDKGYNWGKFDPRFDIAKEPNEANRAGYIVEIDPLNPEHTPKKRTALGRFKHENAEVVIANNNKIVVYLGDDERGEYLYKFVSKNTYKKTGNNQNLLEEGDLFVAKFNDDGTGKWIKLDSESTNMSQAEICIHTRIAASKVGATTMDRPEWVAANPNQAEVYCALTNNKNRGKKPNAGGDSTPINKVNPRKDNRYGQIVRWKPINQDHTSQEFAWNLFVLAGNPTNQTGLNKGSKNIHAGNMFNSPDGLRFDSKGGLWIQTDGKYSNSDKFADMGNNQMLLGNPKTGEIKRFLVGPKECEITGLTWSPDKKTMFVGVQHPGEKGNSNFPGGTGTTPRSSIVAIRRNDNQEIG